MSLLSEIVSRLTSTLQPARPAYTSIVDPCQGRAVVSGGLEICGELTGVRAGEVAV